MFTVRPVWNESLRADSGYALHQLEETMHRLLDVFSRDFTDDWIRLQNTVQSLVPVAPTKDMHTIFWGENTMDSPSTIAGGVVHFQTPRDSPVPPANKMSSVSPIHASKLASFQTMDLAAEDENLDDMM